MNWPLMIRALCDAHGRTPADYQNLTLDHLLILTQDRKTLLPEVTARPAPAPPDMRTDNKQFDGLPGRSLVERIRNAKKPTDPTKPASRKPRRKRGER